jgi:N-acetylglucosaminyldiphosphoundecaprenol N-acetyl-beta-D-mannosaminyltransferase
MPDAKVVIFGVRVNGVTVPDLHEAIRTAIIQNKRYLILNVNILALNLSMEKVWLRDLLNSAKIVFCDGAGVILGARILGYHIPERITYAEWVWKLAKFITENHFSVYFLGGKPGITEKAAQNLLVRFPAIQIVGVHHGYFNMTIGDPENDFVLDSIRKVAPDILIVGFGMPLQEQWLLENWNSLDVKVGLTGGAVFDYISGELHRAPRWMTDNGLEWLGRLFIEPKRLWRRYIIGIPLFFWRIFIHHILRVPLPN